MAKAKTTLTRRRRATVAKPTVLVPSEAELATQPVADWLSASWALDVLGDTLANVAG